MVRGRGTKKEDKICELCVEGIEDENRFVK